MKKLRTISIKNPNLRNLRNNLRVIIIHAVQKEHRRLYLEAEEQGLIGQNNPYSNRIIELHDALKKSICMCRTCSLSDKDMVYVPAIDPFDSGWYCIECYEDHAKDYDKYVIEPERGLIPHIRILRDGKLYMKILRNGTWSFYKKGKEYPIKPPDKISKINKYLTLIQRDNDCIIFVNGEEFIQCLGLYFTISSDDKNLKEINSIDDMERYIMPSHYSGPFWAHYSNLQMWAECNYDTRLLHRNLAFPLLKKLTEVSDPIAKRVFKEEIAKRYLEGNQIVRKYLKKEDYLSYLNKDELYLISKK